MNSKNICCRFVLLNAALWFSVYFMLIHFKQFSHKQLTVKREQLLGSDRSALSFIGRYFSKSETHVEKTFRILYWTKSWYGDPWFGLGSAPFQNCTYRNCILSSRLDKEREYNSSDAVLFHMVFLTEFPTYRFLWQKWIMHQREAPIHQHGYRHFDDVFNATWTYDRRSDIWTNYTQDNKGGYFLKRQSPDKQLLTKNYSAGRSKLAAWFVSNCHMQPSKRFQYVTNLKKYMQVDIYGACGTLKCDSQHRYQCQDMIGKTYKFYFAFENCICDDYLTEKIWTALLVDVVPVVMGGYNYSELLPPGSYIDVKDYKSPKELAQHLNMLHKNDEKYNSYLTWKAHYKLEPHPPIQCNLCEYLNKSHNVTKIYDRLDLFWGKDKCYTPENFYKNVDKSSWV